MKAPGSEDLFRLISDAYPGLLLYLDLNCRILFANAQFNQWFNKSPEEVYGLPMIDFPDTENLIQTKSFLEKVFNGEEVKVTTTLPHSAVGLRDVEVIYRPDFNELGRVKGFIVMAYDITEQKKAERLALENESRFRSLTELMPQLVWEANADSEVVWLNELWARLTGTQMEQNLGHGWLNIIHPEDRDQVKEVWQETVRQKRAGSTEYRLKMLDGSYRWFIARATPVLDENNNVIRWVGTSTDIEDQKTAKDISEKERAKLHSLFMQAPFSILMTKGPGHIIELENSEAKKYFPGGDLSGLSVSEGLQEMISTGVVVIMDEIYQSGIGQTFKSLPLALRQPDGSMFNYFVDLFLEPIKNDAGKTTGLLCLILDVTQQVLALKLVEESELIFRDYADSIPQIAYITNVEGEVVHYNRQWYEFSGADPESTADWNIGLFIHPEDVEEVASRWRESIVTSKTFEYEYRLKRRDGEYRWHLSRALPIKDSRGQITKWVGTDTDIHEQKEIARNQGRLLQLLESSTDFIGVIDQDGKGIFINRAAKEMIGIDGDLDTMARDFTSIFFEEDLPFVKDVILATTKNKGQWVGDFRLRHVKTGKAVWVHYNSFTTHDESTGEFTGYATVSRNMTEIKNKERKLEEALKARDQFLSMASHELKTPLTSLKLQAQLNLRNLENHKSIPIETQMTHAHQANQTIGRLVKLIDDMLDVSRIRNGKLKLDKQNHELGDIVREVVQRMSILFESAGLQIPPTQFREKIHGHWDRFRLEQVIGNLLTNAIKYGRHKPVEICIRKNKTHAILTVKDHGYGIAQEDLKKIFDRFERGVHFSEVSGLGLGLFISKEIVRSHGGHILVESRLDVGSTFTISLPLTLESSQM